MRAELPVRAFVHIHSPFRWRGRPRLGVWLRGNWRAGKRIELGEVESGENAAESGVQGGGAAVGPRRRRRRCEDDRASAAPIGHKHLRRGKRRSPKIPLYVLDVDLLRAG